MVNVGKFKWNHSMPNDKEEKYKTAREFQAFIFIAHISNCECNSH